MISNVVAFLVIAASVAYGLPCGGFVGTGCGGYGLGLGAGLGVGLGTGVLPAAGVLGGGLLGAPLVGGGCVTGISAPAIASPVFTTGIVGASLGYGLSGGLVTPIC